ncbi:MAG TPA: hypothetical protein VH183_08230 [Burkholderiaceae bacterium]|jgi:hypothetical protein|nr:hypothetical protein [Burkholderiaceae bacterium]
MRLFIGIALVLVSAQAHAADSWSNADLMRQGIFTAVEIIDWGQTRYLAKHPDRYHEINPFLGQHPSVGRVDTLFSVSLVANAGVTWVLPARYRPYWQWGRIGIEAGLIAHNARIGIRMDF